MRLFVVFVGVGERALPAVFSAKVDRLVTRDARNPEPATLNVSSPVRSMRTVLLPRISSDDKSSDKYGTIVRLLYAAAPFKSCSVNSFETT